MEQPLQLGAAKSFSYDYYSTACVKLIQMHQFPFALIKVSKLTNHKQANIPILDKLFTKNCIIVQQRFND